MARKKNSVALEVKKPISVWNKPLKANFKDFFKSLTKMATHLVAPDKGWSDVVAEGIEAIGALGLKTTPEETAWILLRRALARAIYDLVGELAAELAGKDLPDPDALCDKLDLSLEESELAIERSFFDNPKSIPLLGQVQVPFEQWLIESGLDKKQAKAVVRRLPEYFVYSLNEEWRAHAEDYAKLKEWLSTPFMGATEREHAWRFYAARLNRQLNERMFGEVFGLIHVYVPLRAYYTEQIKDGDPKLEPVRRGLGHEPQRRVVHWLEEELDAWIDKADRRDAIRVVCGGPGAGKSSFVKVFAARRAAKGSKVLLVPLHLFNLRGDLEQSVGEFVRQTEIFRENPLDPELAEDRLLLIFDGLDELAMQGRVAAETAREFVREVDKYVEKRNHERLRLQVIISGRELVVQENRSEFRKPRQILHLLPYYVPKREREAYKDPQTLLAQDQRGAWWRGYGTFKEKEYGDLPRELMRPDLEDVTAQPLLNYLVALSYERKKIDFSQDVNLNKIYKDLIEAVHERAYAGGTLHPGARGLSSDDFMRVLEEIGLTAWKGDGRTTTVREIEAHCTDSGLTKRLELFQEKAGAGVTRLLTAFYFRQAGYRQDGERTFEFTHKSFGEYLAARRIVRGLRWMSKQLQQRQEDPDEGHDEKSVLKKWAEICGPTAMDRDLFRFVAQEVRLAGGDDAARWQSMLGSLIGYMLRHGMPMEELKLTYHESCRRARNAEEALLACLNACARVTREVSQIKWPEPTSAGTWLARLQGQRMGPENVLALGCLGDVNLQECRLDMHDLYEANLKCSVLAQVNAYWANLERAKLEGANLALANLALANLVLANLAGANLEGAKLEGANLALANLALANLAGANLEEANLEEANLAGANLEGAKLAGARLRRSDLRHVDVERVDLSRVVWLDEPSSLSDDDEDDDDDT